MLSPPPAPFSLISSRTAIWLCCSRYLKCLPCLLSCLSERGANVALCV
uniref:Uncharacterized protein n=1 Tax=Anguilla anguilla TaxID=7936 RepID=A0A0E9SNB4_ANGAN